MKLTSQIIAVLIGTAFVLVLTACTPKDDRPSTTSPEDILLTLPGERPQVYKPCYKDCETNKPGTEVIETVTLEVLKTQRTIGSVRCCRIIRSGGQVFEGKCYDFQSNSCPTGDWERAK